MITYKISQGSWTTYKLFNDIVEAEQWTLTNLGTGYTVEVSPDIQITLPTAEEKLESDLKFGAILIDMFLLDNRLIVPHVTPTESLNLLSEFNNIEKLARLGDIKSVSILMNGVQTDNRIFTQERKDKYLSLIFGHLA